MKKSIIAIYMLIFTGVFMSCAIHPLKQIEKRWDIRFPDGTVEFSASDRGGFQGDGSTYIVLKLKKEPTEFISDFSKYKNSTYEYYVNMSLSGDASLNIPEDKLPKFEQGYYSKFIGKKPIDDHSDEYFRYFKKLFIIYFPDTLCFIIYEVLI